MKNTYVIVHLSINSSLVRYLSNESTRSCRGAGMAPPRFLGLRGTGGSTGLSELDECCCFSISHLPELRLVRCECLLSSSSLLAESLCLGSHLSLAVRVQQSALRSSLLPAAADSVSLYLCRLEEAAMTKPPAAKPIFRSLTYRQPYILCVCIFFSTRNNV